MRIPAKLLAAATPLVLAAQTLCQAEIVEIDTYWQRSSGIRTYDSLAPFRQPKGIDIIERGQLIDLLDNLINMLAIASQAKPGALSFDRDGRQICKSKGWAREYENVKANSQTHPRHLPAHRPVLLCKTRKKAGHHQVPSRRNLRRAEV